MSGTGPKHAAAPTKPARGLAASIAQDLATRTNATIAALLAIVGITGLSGGFSEAAPEGVFFADLASGTGALAEPLAVEAAPLELEIRRTYELDGARVVEMRVLNTASRPIPASRLLTAFQLQDSNVPVGQQPKFAKINHRLTSEEPLTEVPFAGLIAPNPGVPLDMAVIFTDPLDGGAGRAADADTLVISSLEYRTSILDGSTSWLLGDPVAEVALR